VHHLVLSQCTRVTDGQTDRITTSQDHASIAARAVKTNRLDNVCQNSYVADAEIIRTSNSESWLRHQSLTRSSASDWTARDADVGAHSLSL